MVKILAIHSFRGGTGKSNLAANLAAVLAMGKRRVAIIDTDLASPGVHVLFGFTPTSDQSTLNDHLEGMVPILDCAHDVTPDEVKRSHGKVWLVPAAMSSDRIARLLREGYEVERLNDALFELAELLRLDVIIIDTHPGINEETLLSTAIADCLMMVIRPDRQDYLGTAVVVEVAQRLDVPAIRMVINKLPSYFDAQQVSDRVSSSYHAPIGALLPLCDELLTLASGDLAVLRFADHPWSEGVRRLAQDLAVSVL